VVDETHFITLDIARSGITRDRGGRAAAIPEVNDAGRELIVNVITVTSLEARWQNQDRYRRQGESIFVHGLFLSFHPFVYLS
jgi:hypothetical protein